MFACRPLRDANRWVLARIACFQGTLTGYAEMDASQIFSKLAQARIAMAMGHGGCVRLRAASSRAVGGFHQPRQIGRGFLGRRVAIYAKGR